MQWRKRGVVCGVAFVVMCVTIPSSSSRCAAGIVVTGRESTIAASGQITGDQFDLTDTSTTPGPYDNTVEKSLPVGEDATSASASQRANVAANALPTEARGTASADIAELDAISAQARSFLNVVFDVVDQSETISINGHVQSTFDGAARVTLEGTSGTLFERRLEIGDESQLDFDESLELAPGSYTLSAETHVTGTITPNVAEFDFAVSSGPKVAIPLPAPVLLGGVSMLLLGAWPIRRRFIAIF